jgi:hypothetical protein
MTNGPHLVCRRLSSQKDVLSHTLSPWVKLQNQIFKPIQKWKEYPVPAASNVHQKHDTKLDTNMLYFQGLIAEYKSDVSDCIFCTGGKPWLEANLVAPTFVNSNLLQGPNSGKWKEVLGLHSSGNVERSSTQHDTPFAKTENLLWCSIAQRAYTAKAKHR